MDWFPQLRTVLTVGAQRRLVAGALASIGIALLDSVAVALVLPLVDLASGNGQDSEWVERIRVLVGSPSDDQLTIGLAVLVVGLFIAKDLASLGVLWWGSNFIHIERARTSTIVMRRILGTPYTALSRRSSAELLRTIDAAVMQVFNCTVNGLFQSLVSGAAIVTMLVVLFVLAPLATTLLVVYFGVASLLFDRFARPRARRAGQVVADASLRSYRNAFATFGAVKELKLRGTAEVFVGRYNDSQLESARAAGRAGFLAGLPRYLFEVLFIVAVGMVILVDAMASNGSKSAIGILALFVAAGFRLLPAISSFMSNSTNIRVGFEPLRLVYTELTNDATEEEVRVAGGSVLLPDTGPLKAERVSFRYPDTDVEVLHDVSLAVQQGATVALVGGSGAGKTTLADILVGLHVPESGAVTIDGVDVRTDLAGWRRRVGYVPQDVFILDATLVANIAFDEEPHEIDMSRVELAVARAQLSELVSALPHGLHAELGERGVLLSGGQRQRIGIARALYRDCSVLVLDEATSALDNETEFRINQIIASLRGQVTVIVIAHRLSTVRDVDQLVYLERGEVVATGTFDEVRRSSKAFARLVELGSLEPNLSGGLNPTSLAEEVSR